MSWPPLTWDHYTFLGNCPPTPPLSQYFALSEKCWCWLRGGIGELNPPVVLLRFNPPKKASEETLKYRKEYKNTPIDNRINAFLTYDFWISCFRGILSRQPKTEWKCAYNELLNERKKEDILASPLRKRSKTSMDVSSDCDTLKKERQKVRFKESETLDPEAETCPTCLQIIAKDTKDYDSLMDKSVSTFCIDDSSGLWLV